MGSDLYFEPLFQEEFVALMPENHPLAQKEVIVPEDFRRYRLLITSATCPYRRKLEMVLQEKGNVTLDTMEIGSMTALNGPDDRRKPHTHDIRDLVQGIGIPVPTGESKAL